VNVLRVAILGFGFMGQTHYQAWKKQPGVQVVALCDANPNFVQDSQKTQGNIALNKEPIDFSALGIYHDFNDMLKREKLDVVSITLPTFLHADFTVQALKAGLSVLCEKPMALTAKDCDRMISAAGKSGKKLQIGHCLRFWPEYVWAKNIVESKTYGSLRAASFRRYTAMPAWSDSWFADESRSGGMPLDLHIHDVDYIQYLLGMPESITSYGIQNKNNSIIHIVSQYEYDGHLITAEGGWAMMPTFVFEMGFTLILERATVVFTTRNQPTIQVFPAQGEVFTPELPQNDGYFNEIAYFARELQGISQPQIITPQQARDSVRLVELEKKSVQTGKKVMVKVNKAK